MAMKKCQGVYAWLIIAAGFVLTAISVPEVVALVQDGGTAVVIRLVLLTLLMALFRSLPLYISRSQSVDVSFIVVFAAVMTLSPGVAMVLFSVSMLLSFEREPTENRMRSYLSYPLIKVFFNNNMVVLSVFAAGQLYHLMGGMDQAFVLPDSLLPSFAFALTVVLLNMAQITVLFFLGGMKVRETLVKNLLGILPNMLATIPIGILLSWLLLLENGEYIMILFLLPLLLARYSFKLYLDSKDHYYNIIGALSAAIEAKDPYTEGHSRRVEQYSVMIGQTMRLPNSHIENLKVASLLHDIGKIGIDDTVLRKNGALDPHEWEIVRRHPEIGYRIVEQITLPDVIKMSILHHHERFDGSGYPKGIELSTLPVEASILSAADAFDAMTSDRPYRKGMSKHRAISILREEAGRQFHPEVVVAFERNLDKFDLP